MFYSSRGLVPGGGGDVEFIRFRSWCLRGVRDLGVFHVLGHHWRAAERRQPQRQIQRYPLDRSNRVRATLVARQNFLATDLLATAFKKNWRTLQTNENVDNCKPTQWEIF
jgi:hypothetical protein